MKDVTEKHYTRRELQQLAEAVAKIDLVWAAGVEPLGTVPAVVPAGTTDDDNPPESLAPPRRLERPTNGLGMGRVRSSQGVRSAAEPMKKALRGTSDSDPESASGPAKQADRCAATTFSVAPSPMQAAAAALLVEAQRAALEGNPADAARLTSMALVLLRPMQATKDEPRLEPDHRDGADVVPIRRLGA